MISKHTDNMNDPIAHKMEIILGTFMRQDKSRTMKESVLTDFSAGHRISTQVV